MARQVAAGLSGWMPPEGPDTGTGDLATLRDLLGAAHPGLAGLALRPLGMGWDCLAAAVGEAWALKVPRDAEAGAALRREAALLARLRGRTPVRVPEPEVFEAPRLHSLHPLIPGGHLLRPAYEALGEGPRDRLARDLAGALHALHGLGRAEAEAAGVARAEERDAAGALAFLPGGLGDAAARVLAAPLPPDPWGEGVGHLDAHGWNMAWDEETGRLNGLLDFGDAAWGPLHAEMAAPALVSWDLAERLAAALGRLKGAASDGLLWRLLAARVRLAELAEEGPEDAFALAMAAEAVGEAARTLP